MNLRTGKAEPMGWIGQNIGLATRLTAEFQTCQCPCGRGKYDSNSTPHKELIHDARY